MDTILRNIYKVYQVNDGIVKYNMELSRYDSTKKNLLERQKGFYISDALGQYHQSLEKNLDILKYKSKHIFMDHIRKEILIFNDIDSKKLNSESDLMEFFKKNQLKFKKLKENNESIWIGFLLPGLPEDYVQFEVDKKKWIIKSNTFYKKVVDNNKIVVYYFVIKYSSFNKIQDEKIQSSDFFKEKENGVIEFQKEFSLYKITDTNK